MIFLADLIKFFSFHLFFYYLFLSIFLIWFSWNFTGSLCECTPDVGLWFDCKTMNIIKTYYWSMKPLRTYEDFLYIDHKMWLQYFCAQNKEKKQNSCETKIGWNSVYSKARNSSWKIEACNIWVNRIKNERIVPTVVANPALVLSP